VNALESVLVCSKYQGESDLTFVLLPVLDQIFV